MDDGSGDIRRYRSVADPRLRTHRHNQHVPRQHVVSTILSRLQSISVVALSSHSHLGITTTFSRAGKSCICPVYGRRNSDPAAISFRVL